MISLYKKLNKNRLLPSNAAQKYEFTVFVTQLKSLTVLEDILLLPKSHMSKYFSIFLLNSMQKSITFETCITWKVVWKKKLQRNAIRPQNVRLSTISPRYHRKLCTRLYTKKRCYLNIDWFVSEPSWIASRMADRRLWWTNLFCVLFPSKCMLNHCFSCETKWGCMHCSSMRAWVGWVRIRWSDWISSYLWGLFKTYQLN